MSEYSARIGELVHCLNFAIRLPEQSDQPDDLAVNETQGIRVDVSMCQCRCATLLAVLKQCCKMHHAAVFMVLMETALQRGF